MSEITRIFEATRQSDPPVAEELLPLVYRELRKLAAHKLANEAPGHTLQPTALVHEAWLRLAGAGDQRWKNRAHFVGAAAEAMRRVLVEHARRKQSLKRGSGDRADGLTETGLELAAPPDELLAVHEALDELGRVDPAAAELVKLRYFVGLTMEETATAMDLPTRTAERLWTYARAWLCRRIRGADHLTQLK